MWAVFKETCLEWFEDNPAQLSAALAFYAIFATAPLLMIAVAIAGLVFGVRATENQIAAALGGIVGEEIALAIQATVKSASQPHSGKVATLVGLGTLFLGAAGVVGHLKYALNSIWEVAPKPGLGLLSGVLEYFQTLLIILGIGIFLLFSLAISTTVAAFSHSLTVTLPGGVALWRWVDLGLSLSLLTLLFALTYKILPSVRLAWRDVWVGSAITAVLFTIGKLLIGQYLARSSVSSAYGAAGSIIVLLLGIYYSAQIFFFGAEFTHIYAQRLGSGIVPTKNAFVITKPRDQQERTKL